MKNYIAKLLLFITAWLFFPYLSAQNQIINRADKSERDDSDKSLNSIEGKVNNQRVELYYKLTGAGKDTIIFIHGTPSTMYAFVKDFEKFSDYFTLIFYDQRGGGRSSLILDPDSLTWQKNVEDLEALRSHFGISNLNLMGVSWGALLSTLYASKYPENVKNLILIPPRIRKSIKLGPMYENYDSSEVARIKELLDLWEISANPDSVCEEYWSIVAPKMLYNYENFKGNFCQEPPEVLRYTWKVSEARMKSLGDWDFRPLVDTLQVKSLIIKGKDSSLKNSKWAEEWAAWLPNSRMLWIDNAGYLPWIDRPDKVLNACKTLVNGGWPENSKKIDKKMLKTKYNSMDKE